MHVDIWIVELLAGVLLTSIIGLQVWIVKQLAYSRVKRHEQAARIIAMGDSLSKLVYEFEKMRDKMQEHIENSDCRHR